MEWHVGVECLSLSVFSSISGLLTCLIKLFMYLCVVDSSGEIVFSSSVILLCFDLLLFMLFMISAINLFRAAVVFSYDISWYEIKEIIIVSSLFSSNVYKSVYETCMILYIIRYQRK